MARPAPPDAADATPDPAAAKAARAPAAPAAAADQADRPAAWLDRRERGTVFAIHAVFRLAMLCGRRPLRALVSLIALWYRLTDRQVVAASRDWLTRVHGRPPGFRAVYRHIRAFVQVTLDRVFLLSGRTRGLTFTISGEEHLRRRMATGRGAILLGAHVGSWEALRASGADLRIPVRILGYFENARMINALLERLNPGEAERVIHLGTDPVGVMARVRARLEQGEFVALLGDRVGLNDRVVRARFLGEPAAFAAGPFLLAAVLRCPVYLTFGLYREPGRYDLSCEPFAERIELPRRDREGALADVVQRYATRLEEVARGAPDNWFNFYDFWSNA
jgi:predicted LPLAT superfamily acyltransferase